MPIIIKIKEIVKKELKNFKVRLIMLSPKELRKLVPFTKEVHYLDSASVAPASTRVWAAMQEYGVRYPLNYGVGEFPASVRAASLVDEARKKLARFINARFPEEIIFTKNTTEAINLAANGYPWKAGDEVILTTLEHQSNIMPWLRLEKERGIVVKFAQASLEGFVEPETIRALITDKTRLINVTYVSNIYGSVTPVEEIGRIAKEAGVLFMIDAAQAGGRLTMDVQKSGCDFMSICGRKSMMAPQGTGALYIRKELEPQLMPLCVGSRAGHVLDEETVVLNDAPFRFEAGVLNTAGVIGLGVAVDTLSEIGTENIRKWIEELTQYMIDGLLTIPEVELYGTRDASRLAGVISWNVKGRSCSEIASRLGSEANVAVASGAQGSILAIRPLGIKGVVRSSVHYYTAKKDIDALISGLKIILK